MKVLKIEEMKGGWFAGNFDPAAFKTKDFEVGYTIHKKGDFWPKHTHKIITEITLLIKGQMLLQNTLLESGDIFVLEPDEVADPIFLEDCHVIVIKTPSIPGDKVLL
jgi:quercetin dioxygenase-like cupin family protein